MTVPNMLFVMTVICVVIAAWSSLAAALLTPKGRRLKRVGEMVLVTALAYCIAVIIILGAMP